MKFARRSATAALLCGLVLLAPAETTPIPKPPTRLEFRTSMPVDLHFYVRKLASQSVVHESPDLNAAINAARDLDVALGHPLAWGLLEGALADCENIADLVAVFERLPQQFTLRSGKRIRLREPAVRYAKTLAATHRLYFEEHVRARHEKTIQAARKRIRQTLGPKEAACLQDLLRRLAMNDPHDTIPVYLVAEAPPPGGVTHRRRGGGAVCFIAVDALEGSQLYETILHETIHALDVANTDGNSVLAELRKRLQAAGLSPRDRRFRDVPHTLIFVQAGETVRRMLDPSHQHYGRVAGYYAKVPAVSKVVLPAWKAFLDGVISREAAIDRILTGVLADPQGG